MSWFEYQVSYKRSGSHTLYDTDFDSKCVVGVQHGLQDSPLLQEDCGGQRREPCKKVLGLHIRPDPRKETTGLQGMIVRLL